MAEAKQEIQHEVKQKVNKNPKLAEENEEVLIRIAGYDVEGSKNIYVGLTNIKGVSWSMSNVACLKLGIPRNKKISELTKDDIKRIEQFLVNPDIQDYLKNRRKDAEVGETKHFIGSSLEIKKDFDIRNMKKIRSYKGLRHAAGLPARGQRTRSHFRKKGRSVKRVKSGGAGVVPSTPKPAKSEGKKK